MTATMNIKIIIILQRSLRPITDFFLYEPPISFCYQLKEENNIELYFYDREGIMIQKGSIS